MFNQFFAAARNKNQWYWYVLAVVIILIFAFIFSIPIFLIAGMNGIKDTSKDLNAKDLGLSDALFLGIEMVPSIGLTLGVITSAWIIHKRPWQSLITAHPRIRWERYFFGNLLWLGLVIGGELITYSLYPNNYVFQFEATQFVALLVISVLVIPLQAAGEELFFRGYLMQGLGWGTKKAWIALVVTSVGFGLIHLANPEMEKYGQSFIITYMIMGLFFGVIALMDEGLELAMGVHTINNIYNAVLVTFPGSALELPTVFRIKEYNAWLGFVLEVLLFVFFIWICAKKYGWTDWNKIIQNINDLNSHDISTTDLAINK